MERRRRITMPKPGVLSRVYLQQWQGIRALSYDYLAGLKPSDLALRLPFPESQSLLDQFWCMIGAHESYLRELQAGVWQGFSCSLDALNDYTLGAIVSQMRKSDHTMAEVLGEMDLETPLSNGKRGYEVVQRMVEHEMHHHGQLIHFMYYGRLAIPESWHLKWNLSRED
jgi:hypothetical protein